jgi:2-iminobutanoate/2-iminopropanoate deaminase
MVNKIRNKTDAGPPAIGTYSQAIRTGDLVCVTALSGRDPDTGKLEEGLDAQPRRMLSNLDAILNAAGCTPADIVKVTLLLADIKDFKAVDQIYSAWLPGLGITPLPARTAFAALSLPAGALVMMDVVAAFPVE